MVGPSAHALEESKALWDALVGDRCFCNPGHCKCFSGPVFKRDLIKRFVAPALILGMLSGCTTHYKYEQVDDSWNGITTTKVSDHDEPVVNGDTAFKFIVAGVVAAVFVLSP